MGSSACPQATQVFQPGEMGVPILDTTHPPSMRGSVLCSEADWEIGKGVEMSVLRSLLPPPIDDCEMVQIPVKIH